DQFFRPQAPVIESVKDNVGDIIGDLKVGDITDDNRPVFTGRTEPGNSVQIFNGKNFVGNAQVDNQGNWTFTPENALDDGQYSFTAIATSATGNPGPASEAFDLVIFTGEGPSQFAKVLSMGKDSGLDGQDFITNNGDLGRMVYGSLNAKLSEGQTLEVSHDGGRTWSTALVEGMNWASQDKVQHSTSWTIQTRVKDGENYGYVMSQSVTLDKVNDNKPLSGRIEGHELIVELPRQISVGERVVVYADKTESYFIHVLTAEDLANGSVRIETGSIKSANIAIADAAGNLSGYLSVNALTVPATPYTVKGDESEIISAGRSDTVEVSDVRLLDNIKLIEGNLGKDKLALTGSDQELDLSALNTRLSSIEVFDITGIGNNTLKISLGDVLNLGADNLFIKHDLVQVGVLGDEGDVVKLSNLLSNGMQAGVWEQNSFVTVSGIVYDVYLNKAMNAELVVQQGVHVDLI
ncbi:Ig-like domain-containing protein, partial [Pseudomonas mosselii]|uniref:Ig-like domain-containing protein n=1 Tax=Pseudomonas mosselii TaxID=78327 RepID=UPI003F3598E8